MIERIRTALVLVTIVLLCMFATDNPIPMMALMLVTVAIGSFEWAKLVPNQFHKPYAALVILITICVYFVPQSWPYFWVASLLFWIVSLIWTKRYPKKTEWYNSTLNIWGAVLLVAAVLAIFDLWEKSPWWLMYVFALVWSADSGAYFVGRKLGKNKLAPHVSPNKSIEGLVGGVLLSIIVVVVVAFTALELSAMQLANFVILSVITVLASVQGDLFESMVKRQAGIKDSGSILPGHGGVLDRIDSLLAAAPIFALGLWVQIKFLGGF